MVAPADAPHRSVDSHSSPASVLLSDGKFDMNEKRVSAVERLAFLSLSDQTNETETSAVSPLLFLGLVGTREQSNTLARGCLDRVSQHRMCTLSSSGARCVCSTDSTA